MPRDAQIQLKFSYKMHSSIIEWGVLEIEMHFRYYTFEICFRLKKQNNKEAGTSPKSMQGKSQWI